MSVHLAMALGEVAMPLVIQKLTIMNFICKRVRGDAPLLRAVTGPFEVNSQRYYHGGQPNTWKWKNAIFLLIIFCTNFEDND